MRIAMMVRSYITVPRPSKMIYAPIDLASEIAQGLVRRGHEVDFYAPMGSEIENVNIVTCNMRPMVKTNQEFLDLMHDYTKMTHSTPGSWDLYMANCMFKKARAEKYDVLHFQHPETALPIAQVNPKVPVVYTLNDPAYDWSKELYQMYQTPNQHYISISDDQRRGAPDLPYLATIYNGINPRDYPFSEEHEDYLLYTGRVVPEKGVKEAIEVARQTSNRLLIVGPIYRESEDYFNQYIKPELDDQILYLGYLERDKLPVYYQKAKAVLTPVQWDEPFGLTTIESLASGTPVISFRRGAAPEIIEDGKSGYVVDTTAEMIKSVKRINRIKREDCRKRVQSKFSVSKMVLGYEKAFEDAVRQRRRLPRFLSHAGITNKPRKIKKAVKKQLTRL